jgi:hypothetical protein
VLEISIEMQLHLEEDFKARIPTTHFIWGGDLAVQFFP